MGPTPVAPIGRVGSLPVETVVGATTPPRIEDPRAASPRIVTTAKRTAFIPPVLDTSGRTPAENGRPLLNRCNARRRLCYTTTPWANRISMRSIGGADLVIVGSQRVHRHWTFPVHLGEVRL